MSQAFLECTASKSSVASMPAFITMLEAPPGWSLRYGVQSYTRLLTTIHALSSLLCFSTSDMGMPFLSQSSVVLMSLPAVVGSSFATSPPFLAEPTPTASSAAHTAAVGLFGGVPLLPGAHSVAVADSNLPASSVIQPPDSLPGMVGCSNQTPVPSSSWCTLMRKRQLFIMPMTFHVRNIGCMFWLESTARQQISVQSLSRAASTSVSQRDQHQCLSVPLASAMESSGRVRSEISQDLPPSSEISARMIFRPPPTYA
mmetsp:Transcript_72299/g.156274  ORF Transcript_72299/g.156274 Transcript_72299/m.156274 type:complete len:257 (+) Transcript_72299:144-914(+)